MPAMPTGPNDAPEPSPQHIHLPANVPVVVIPLDYFLRLVDTAAKLKYTPAPLPSRPAHTPEPVDRIAGGAMKSPAPTAITFPGSEWQPHGAAREKKP